jgi:hypothetical protein
VWQRDDFTPPRPSFDQQLEIHRASLISAKAVFERVIEPGKTHVPATTRIATIEERAVIGASIRRRHVQSYRRLISLNVKNRLRAQPSR